MSENPDHFPAVSARLSRVLDDIGMTTLEVSRRRKDCLFEEQLLTLDYTLENRDSTLVYYFGSQSEGTTTSDLNSDADMLFCYTDFNVIQDWPDWQKGKENLLMLHEDTAPGYCRLQVLRRDEPMAMEHLVDPRHTYDRCNRVLLRNTALVSVLPGLKVTHNGPAQTHHCRHGALLHAEVDIVGAYRCNTWPVKADRWKTKHRPRNWPTQSLIQKAVRSGVFLVPVGYKLSETEHLEWRISFSMTERMLMFSLNIIQLKCYVVLKMIMKSIIIPSVGESISSYHCKTALFHCIEDTGVAFWTETNLLQGIKLCLSVLLTWIRNEFCPNFILQESNLFAGKINSQNKVKLVSIMSEIIESDGRFLLLITTDKLGLKLKMNLSSSPVPFSNLESRDFKREVCLHEVYITHAYGHSNVAALLEQMNKTPVEVVQCVRRNINELCDRLVSSGKYERQAIRIYLEIRTCQLGSILASISLSQQKELTCDVLEWFLIAARHDISSELKLATVFFCYFKIEKAEEIIRNIEYVFERNEIQTVCACSLEHGTPLKWNDKMFALLIEKKRVRLFARCIIFSPQEIHCTPPALRDEMNRSAGDDRQHRQPAFDKWMDLAVVDPLPYMYYLQYLTYDKLGKRDLKALSLHNLEQCVRYGHPLYHLETAWNLLGQCMEQEGKPEAAMDCYRASLEVRPRNNAANWHIQKLISKVHTVGTR